MTIYQTLAILAAAVTALAVIILGKASAKNAKAMAAVTMTAMALAILAAMLSKDPTVTAAAIAVTVAAAGSTGGALLANWPSKQWLVLAAIEYAVAVGGTAAAMYSACYPSDIYEGICIGMVLYPAAIAMAGYVQKKAGTLGQFTKKRGDRP